VDTLEIGEYYMVHSDVWKQSNLANTEGMLCIGCLENRIQRVLISSDFSDFPINSPFIFTKSARILSRIFG